MPVDPLILVGAGVFAAFLVGVYSIAYLLERLFPQLRGSGKQGGDREHDRRA